MGSGRASGPLRRRVGKGGASRGYAFELPPSELLGEFTETREEPGGEAESGSEAGDGVRFWNESNWQALCWRCHNRKTATTDGRWG